MSISTRQETASVWLGRGRECHVGVSESDVRIGVSVREWITPDAYRPEDDTLRAPRTNAQVGRRPRKQYVGPDGKRGLSLLSPSQAFELAEALTRAAIEAEAMAEAEGVPA